MAKNQQVAKLFEIVRKIYEKQKVEKRKRKKEIKNHDGTNITKPFNNYKVFLHVCLFQQILGQNIYSMDAH